MLELKILSRLLDYPSEELWENAQLVRDHIQSAESFSDAGKAALLSLLDAIVDRDSIDAQEDYSALFDRGRSVSLLLFEHVHGDSRARGQAMVDLMSVYQRNGFEINARELPDYIPLFLEYLSERPFHEVTEWVSDAAPILSLLKARLEKRESPYQAVFDTLLGWATEVPDLAPLRDTVAREQPDDTPEALDKIWEEEAVSFGGDAVNGGCPTPQRPVREVSSVKWVNEGI
ncbi:Nitrate reductase, delta subunit [gamma proteobacterium HdN1]|nr:Nitrate reductase, delta subunit [gamma proteobacterium HdN1]